MAKRLFLFADIICDLSESDDPLDRPDFPLTREAFDRLTTEDLVAMLLEAHAQDPELGANRPGLVASVGHLLRVKGGVNAVRPTGAAWPGPARWAILPEASLAVLTTLDEMGALTPGVIDEAVWDRLA
ncbi:MAG: hypothetical protein HXY25_12500 [Alphaproteobacteria bacterium]|nr:hypothetical protein [Alphaproteobacteria bacterium]